MDTAPVTAPGTEVSSNPKRPAWLTRNVKVLCGVSFLQDAASELLYPILPIFLTVVLGAPPAVVGAIEGAAEGPPRSPRWPPGGWPTGSPGVR
ncbi:hypothetical protein ACRAWF_20435 [Streptomyces sp. L7]